MPGADNRRFWVGHLKGARLFFVLFHNIASLSLIFCVFCRNLYFTDKKAHANIVVDATVVTATVALTTKGSGEMSNFSRYVNTIDRHLRRRRREYMEPVGLKGIHARMIMAICSNPGCSQDQLAKSMWFDKSTIARQVELLEDMGFLTRKPSEKDKRVLCVFPTEKMLQFQPGLAAAIKASEAELLEGFTEEDKQRLIALLSQVCAKTDRGE